MFPYNLRPNPLDGSSSNDTGLNQRGNEPPQPFPRLSPHQGSPRQIFESSEGAIQFPIDPSNRLEPSRSFNPGFDANFAMSSPYTAPAQGGYPQTLSRPSFAPPPAFDTVFGPSINPYSNYRRQESMESTVFVVRCQFTDYFQAN